TLLFVANLSRFVQHVELNLTGFAGKAPVELMGRTELPAVGTQPYPLTLGPHGFYMLLLESAPTEQAAGAGLPVFTVTSWEEALRPPRAIAEEALLEHV